MEINKRSGPASEQSLDKLVSTRGTVMAGYVVASLFVVAFFIWGGSVPLTTAAIASGVVGVEGHKKQIQHLKGGIVSQIEVRDGDIVAKGQVLLALNATELESEYEELNNRYIQTSAEYARWLAEQKSQTFISTPKWLSDNENQIAVREAIARQSEILTARLAVNEQTNRNLLHKLN